jgi:hypothetical protein
MKLEFSLQVFGKSSNIKFHENPSIGSRVVPCGQADRHNEANSRFFAISLTGLKRVNVKHLEFIAVCRAPDIKRV